jgi:hypothetical protein
VTVQGNATVRGTFTSAHDLTVQGDFNWDDGRIAGTDPLTDTLRVESGGEIPSDVTLDGRRLLVPTGETLRYSDTGSFGSIGFTAENGAILEIQSGARFEATGGEPLNTGAGAAPRIVNRGTLAKPSGSQNTINWDVQNLDSVRVSSSSGGFRIDGSLIGPVGSAGAAEGVFQSSASNLRLNPPSDTIELTRDALLRTTSGGTIEANTNLSGKGSFEIGGDLFAEFPIQMDSSGVELVSGGELIRGTPGSRVSDSVLVLGQGVIEGSGTLDGDVFIDNVRVEPGTDGTAGAMTVDGTYEQSAGTRLDIELGGTTGGTDYDSLSVNGTTLAGELRFDQLNNFTPTTADTLRPVDWGGGGRTGQFDQISGTSSFDGPIRVLYDDTDDTALEVAGKVVPIQAVDPSSLSDTLVFDTTRTQLLQVKNAETDPASDSLKYTLQGQSGASWLSLSQTTGTVGPDIGPNSGTDSVDVTFSTRAGNAPGLYRDTLRVTDQDTDDTTRVPVQLTIERPAITLSTGPQAPSPGTDIAVDIGIPPTLTPKAGTFLYRTAGDETFQTASLDVSGLQDNTAGTLSATVPGSAVTKQGIQYYVQLTSQDTTGSVSINTPAGAPTRPAFVPVEFQEVQAEGSFEPERYRMLAVPVTGLGDRSVFDVLTDQYGEYDPSEWRFSRWVPSQSAYREGADVGPLQPGEAAWLIIKQGDPLTITNGAQSVDASAPRSISLDPGWNQVGNPFPFPVAWADVTRPAPVRPPVGYDGSRPEGERFRFGIDVLPPWNGAFVFNSADTSVTLEVPPEGASTPSAATQGRALTQTKSSEGGYRLQATAHVSAGGTRWTSRPVQVGFASDAEEGIDTKDRLQPPAVRSHVRLQAVPSEGPALARSVKPVPATDASAAQRGGAWNLTLRLGEEGQSAERASLRLSAQEALPESFRRYVVDRDENRRLPLTHETATVPLSEGRSTRRLRVIVGTKAFAQAHSDGAKMAVEKTTLHANAPNPFSESTTIPYQVAEDTHVRIAVYDLLGRRVSVLVNGTREAGVHEFQWQPGERGAALASGTYFCRMTAGGETFTQKLVVVR